MIRVLIADDNPVIRGGLSGLLALQDDILVCGEAGTGKDAIRVAKSKLPHVVLLDVRMPVMDGLEAAGPLSEIARVLMLTYAEDADIVTSAIKAGAAGYLVHGRFEPDELARAIRDVHEGRSFVSPAVAPALFDLVRNGDHTPPGPASAGSAGGLTERETEVMNLIAKGLSNSRISAELYISEKTVKNHINRAYAKLGVTNRAEAIAAWLGTAVSA